VVLVNSAAAEERRIALVTGAGIDLHAKEANDNTEY
jgi:hypothetical protein